MRVSGSAAAVVCVVILVLVPLLYVASVGPAVWSASRGYIGEWALVVYFPLELLADACEPIGTALERYVELWDTPVVMSSPPPAMPIPTMAAPLPAPASGS